MQDASVAPQLALSEILRVGSGIGGLHWIQPVYRGAGALQQCVPGPHLAVRKLISAPAGFLDLVEAGEKLLHFVGMLRGQVLLLPGILRQVKQLGLRVVAQLVAGLIALAAAGSPG